MTVILVAGSVLIVLMATFAIALGRAASRADEELDRLVLEHGAADAARSWRESYAGLAAAQSAISREPSITAPPSSRSAGTQRLPVSSATSRLPRVWLKIPGSAAKP